MQGNVTLRREARESSLTKQYHLAYTTCIAPQATYYNCRGAVHVAD